MCDSCRAVLRVGAVARCRATGLWGHWIKYIGGPPPRVAFPGIDQHGPPSRPIPPGMSEYEPRPPSGRSPAPPTSALLAANRADDADTVAAVTGQLAGALYGLTGIPETWRDRIVWQDRLLTAARRLLPESTGSIQGLSVRVRPPSP